LGAAYHGQQSGTFSDMAVYSFNGNKILTTSGGGVLLSDNEQWIAKAKFLSTQAKEDFLHYEHKEFGYNYRMSNVLAAIGVAQMEVLDERVERRREVFELYQNILDDIEEIAFMPQIEGAMGNRWLTTLIFRQTDPKMIIDALERENIEARPLWKPMHLQPLFRDDIAVVDGASEALFCKGICLPSGSCMSDEDVKRVCHTVLEILS